MISLKTGQELAVMSEGGKRLAKVLEELLSHAKPGVSLLELDQEADTLISQESGTPSFKTVPGYRWATCLCVNDVIVHGVPTTEKLREGDLLTIDVGMIYGGLHTDAAWTKLVGSSAPTKEIEKFLRIGQEALNAGIAACVVGRRVGNISQAIGEIVEGAGYFIVRSLVGHGVGKKLHEEPQVPGKLLLPVEQTPSLQVGMALAIEVIYTAGRGGLAYDEGDGWTIRTKDGSLASVFEHTVALTPDGTRVLTAR